MADVKSEIRGSAGIIFFANPDGGFLTSEMVDMAIEKFDALRADENVRRRLFFTGALDEIFIRHFSVEEIIAMSSALRENNKAGVTPERFALSPLRAFWEKVDNCPKPTIAAINGVCGGGGCELALACDIRLAAKGSYTIGQMEICRHFARAGGTVRLSRLVDPGKAMEYILRGKTFYPDEALEIGLVNQVVEGDVLEEALVMAGEFDDKPPRALAAIKQAVKASWGKTTLDGVLEEGDLFADLIATDDQAVKMMEDYVANGHVFKKI